MATPRGKPARAKAERCDSRYCGLFFSPYSLAHHYPTGSGAESVAQLPRCRMAEIFMAGDPPFAIATWKACARRASRAEGTEEGWLTADMVDVVQMRRLLGELP